MTSAVSDTSLLTRPDLPGPALSRVTRDDRWQQVEAELITGGKSNLTYLLRSPAGELVLRRPPSGAILTTAHDMKREVRVQRALAGTPVPVPAIVLSDDGDLLGVPCYVMTRVDGLVIRDRLPAGLVIAPEAINCQAPDTGNAETLHLFGTPEQKKEWLEPLLEGTIRSAFAMTEPDVASSDATNIATSIARDGDDYVINGRKWWISGAADERCRIFIVMGKTDSAAPAHRQQSMVLVPRDTPGLTIARHLPIFGYQDQHGHSELVFDDVRVPVGNRLAGEGDGFLISQARLGPGRIHHAMRAIGMAERALSLLIDRAKSRVAFGGPLIDQGVVQDLIARSRIEIEQARLLVLKTAWLIDQYGAKNARTEIAAIKVAAPAVATAVIDRAIEVFGGAGVSDDYPSPTSTPGHASCASSTDPTPSTAGRSPARRSGATAPSGASGVALPAITREV
jgi:alkylation response protein AidB-like acyl-CoA dehydrogenase